MKLSECIASLRADIFARNLVTVGPEEPVSWVALQMREYDIGTVVVVEDQKPIGIVTDRDLALALGIRDISPQVAVKSVMTTPIRTIPDSAGIFAATQCMSDARVRRLPIVNEQGRLVGIVSLDDLMWLLGRELYNLADGIKHQTQLRQPDGSLTAAAFSAAATPAVRS